MKEKQLELDITASPGITAWFDAGKVQPAEDGWYGVRRKMSDEEREIRKPLSERRWWSGREKCFSRPVVVGEDWDPRDILIAQLQASRIALHDLEWHGLLAPHPELEKPEGARKRIKIVG
jgi:hypothetical protein